MLLSVQKECNELQQDEERPQDDEWFDEIDAQTFSFKGKIHAWLRQVSEKKQSSRSSSEGRSKSSKSSREAKSSKKKEIEDKIKVAKLMAEAELLEKHILETEARKLKIKEELAKTKARLSGYHDIPVDYIQIKQENAQQRWENQKEKVSSTRDQKHQQTKITVKTNHAWDNQRMHGPIKECMGQI